MNARAFLHDHVGHAPAIGYPEALPARTYLHFRFLAGSGGTLIDPDGLLSAVQSLHAVYGDRLDLQDLLASIEHTNTTETQQAADLVRRLISNTRGNS